MSKTCAIIYPSVYDLAAIFMPAALRILHTVIVQSNGLNCAVFAGKDASRALAKSSVKPEDCSAEWEDLPENEKKVLDDWMTFFSKRYNIVGKVVQ